MRGPRIGSGDRGGYRPPGGRFRSLGVRVVLLCPALLVASAVLAGGAHGNHASAPGSSALTASASAPAVYRPPVAIGSVVHLSDGALPSSICENNQYQCPALAGQSEVTLAVQAGARGQNSWPAVQLVFLLETTPYDGVFDPTAGVPGSDPCADAAAGSAALCDEANLVPFFAANAGGIAESLQSEYPNTTMSFALADFFATHDAWDTGGGSAYRVDVGHFVNSTQFGPAVSEGFVNAVLGGSSILPGSDLKQNFLTSDSISALYQALLGQGNINWSSSAHHVIVVLGSTAPRDPNYLENYCVSPAVTPHGLQNCTATPCEPASLVNGTPMPKCEGWVLSAAGNKSDTIAALAHAAPSCVGSLGGNCTIDVVDVNGTPTNPWSPSWSAAGGSGGPANWTADARGILQAGCDMASATSGSWAGPNWFTCAPLGTKGTLLGVPFGDPDFPHAANPLLYTALTKVGLGTVPTPVVASGAGQPMFQFLPWGNFGPSYFPQWTVHCFNGTGAAKPCPSFPTISYDNNVPVYGWNWSNDPTRNAMHLGDTWALTFFVSAYGPPYGLLPVDSCTTLACLAAGSNQVLGFFTSMTFYEYGSSKVVTLSFGLMEVTLEPVAPPGAPAPPTPPVLPGPAPSAPPTPPTGLLPPTPAPPIPAAVISVEAAAAGFIAAGWTAIGVRTPPLATKQASLSGAMAPKKRRRHAGSGRLPLFRWE
ncbi:MAG: hypothetical protein L3J95_06605 [Thermoplasmata archaeon]|nr:hypothetical protein [Thermoplasmata archaeon]